MAQQKRRKRMPRTEFKPDARHGAVIKTLRLTRQQRLRLLRWVAYVAAIVMALVVQDVIMSKIRIFGATTDLAVAVILMITVLEGVDVGSLFVLIASTLYYFSGSAPGAYSIGLITFAGIFVSLIRQMYLRRSRGAIILCAGAAQMVYVIGLYAVGLFSGLTRWDRLFALLVSGGLNILVMIPLYPLIYKIGMIGGNVWKE